MRAKAGCAGRTVDMKAGWQLGEALQMLGHVRAYQGEKRRIEVCCQTERQMPKKYWKIGDGGVSEVINEPKGEWGERQGETVREAVRRKTEGGCDITIDRWYLGCGM